MEYPSLKDHVYYYLVEKINQNELKPNDRIRENTIAEETGISRTPIREALIQLAGDGIISREPRKGFRVSSLDLKKAQDIYELMGLLDGYMAKEMVQSLKEEDLTRMQQLIEKMQGAIDQGDLLGYHEYQAAFHDCYIKQFPNQTMIETFERMRNMFLRKWYVFKDKQTMVSVLNETNRQHQQMLELFRKKDTAALGAYVHEVHWGSDQALFETMNGQEKDEE